MLRNHLCTSFAVTKIDKEIVSEPGVVVVLVQATVMGLMVFGYVHYVDTIQLLIVLFWATVFLR